MTGLMLAYVTSHDVARGDTHHTATTGRVLSTGSASATDWGFRRQRSSGLP